MTSTTALPPSRIAAKMLGSIGVVAAAAAVAGLGTFGSFTDSTSLLDNEVSTGTVSIDLAAAANVMYFPQVAGGWAAGDSSTFPIDLKNSGTVALSSITMDITAPWTSALDTDEEHGLQLSIQSCTASWTTTTDGYTCPEETIGMYAGPIVTSQELIGAASLAAGGVDHLLITVTLPEDAGNHFQDATSVIRGQFTAIQRAGAAR